MIRRNVAAPLKVIAARVEKCLITFPVEGAGGLRARAITGPRRAGGDSRKEPPGVDKQKFWREFRGWTYTIVGVLAFRAFLYEAVYIPSGSMIPTLQIGDYVIVEKWAYGARLPFTRTARRVLAAAGGGQGAARAFGKKMKKRS